MKCELCPLSKKSGIVCANGSGPAACDVMLVADAPLTGSVARKLSARIQDAGLIRSGIYLTYAVKCGPLYDSVPSGKMIDACRPYLEREIRKVRPKVIVCMGATAITSVLGIQAPVIKNSRGVRIRSDEFGCDVVVTYHPSTTISHHDPRGTKKKEFIADLRRAKLGEDAKSGVKSVVVKTLKELKNLYRTVKDASEVSYDTENGGDTEDDALNPFRNIFLCLSLSVDGNTGYVIPWRKQGRKLFWPSFERKRAKSLIQKILSEMERKRQHGGFIAGNNIVYDNLTLRNQGFDPPRPSCDNMLGDVLLDENRSHSLEAQVARWTQLGNYKGAFALFCSQHKIKDFSQVPDKELWEYTGGDAVASRQIGPIVRKKLSKSKRSHSVFQNMMKFSYICELMSWRGVLLDRKRLLETSQKVSTDIASWQYQLRKWSGNSSLNIDSPVQLRDVFFKSRHGTCKHRHKPTKTSETTKLPSTDKSVLNQLKTDGCKFADVLLQCRYWGKIRNTYLVGKGGQGGIFQFIESDGKVHPRWNQHLVKTQRLSANNPPMQTLPRGNIIRNLFVPKKGYHFVIGDSKQSELRVIAVLAKDKPLLETFKKGGDPHAETGAIISRVPLEKVTKEQRQRGKGVNFSIVFLQGSKSLGASIGVSEMQAQKYLDDWYRVHYRVKELQDKLKNQIKTRGYVESPHGRLRHFPDFHEKTFSQQNEDLRAGVNHPVQSGSRLMVQRAMISLQEEFEKHPTWDAGFVVDAHDGFVIEVKRKYSQRVAKLVKEVGERPDPDLSDYSFPWDVKICEDKWEEG